MKILMRTSFVDIWASLEISLGEKQIGQTDILTNECIIFKG